MVYTCSSCRTQGEDRRSGCPPGRRQPTATASTTAAGRRSGSADGFVWGTATSSYQIEGAVDGRRPRREHLGPLLPRRRATIADGSSGAVACDHYHRWSDDIALMRRARPRRLPLLDRLAPGHARGHRRRSTRPGSTSTTGSSTDCSPPASSRSRRCTTGTCRRRSRTRAAGRSRATADAFADYAEVVVARLGDRVGDVDDAQRAVRRRQPRLPHRRARAGPRDRWPTASPPPITCSLGHGLAAAADPRARARGAEAGIMLNFTPASRRATAPADVDRGRAHRRPREPVVRRADHRPRLPGATPERLGWDQRRGARRRPRPDRRSRSTSSASTSTPASWSAPSTASVDAPAPRRRWVGRSTPTSLGSLLRTLHERYGFPRYFITENGAAMPDTDRRDGRIDDHDRIALPRAPTSPRSHDGHRRRRARRRLLRVVAARQLRVGPRLRTAVRHRRGRPRAPWTGSPRRAPSGTADVCRPAPSARDHRLTATAAGRSAAGRREVVGAPPARRAGRSASTSDSTARRRRRATSTVNVAVSPGNSEISWRSTCGSGTTGRPSGRGRAPALSAPAREAERVPATGSGRSSDTAAGAG